MMTCVDRRVSNHAADASPPRSWRSFETHRCAMLLRMRLSDFRFDFQTTRHASSPLFFAARGAPYPISSPGKSAEGTERRVAHHHRPPCDRLRLSASADGGGRASCDRRARHSALHRGDFSPRGRASGRRRNPHGSLIRAAFATLRRRRVQPLKAAPRSGGGRRPGASREQAYEACARAPHLPRSQDVS
jgi:hypothetical protein